MINVFINRIFRAIKIDIELFEEVEKDKKATFQAGAVVVLSSLAAGVGSIHLGASNFLVAPALSLLSWYVWAYVIYFVGVKLFRDPKTKSNHGELLRTIGFSSAPGLIRVFGVTPDLMAVTFIGSAFWMLACMVVGVRAALDYKSLSIKVKEYVQKNTHQLIETLIENIAEILLKDFNIEYVTISISKPGAIRDSQDVGIEITRKKNLST